MIRKVFLLFYLFGCSYSATDPACDTEREINNWKRSVNYEPTSDDNEICDSHLEEGWYRITSHAGERMPTYCPEFGFKCCTTNSLWLSNENVPVGEDLYPVQVNQVVERVACAAHFSGNCCKYKTNIKIKNCGTHLAYFLTPPTFCNTAYCFGDKLPCPDGTNSETGFPPNCDVFPTHVISPKPKVRTDIHIEENKRITTRFETVEFECEAPGLDPKFTCNVRWYINNVLIKRATKKGVQANKLNQALLLQSHWDKDFKPNMNVKCSLQLLQVGFNAPGYEQFSDEFMAGFEILQRQFIVLENTNVSVPVKITIPVGCRYNTSFSLSNIQKIREKSCVINLLASIPRYQQNPGGQCSNGILKENDLKFDGHQCGIFFSNANWTEPQHIHISAPSDGIAANEDRLVAVRLYQDMNRVDTGVPELNFYNGVMLGDIQVRIRDTDVDLLGRSCSSNNDPHMTTFDGAKFGFHAKEGEYVLYRHKDLPVEVHGYYRKCNGGALCNCGVGVRSGDSAFIANYCIVNGKRNTYVTQRQCGNNEINVEENGNSYKITTITGSVIKITLGIVATGLSSFFGLNSLTITPSQIDFEKTEGLCGFLNGFWADDLKSPGNVNDYSHRNGDDRLEPLASDWSILVKSDSLFNIYQTKPRVTYGKEYCSCIKNATSYPFGEPNVRCKQSTNMDLCEKAHLSSVYEASCKKTEIRTRRRRSAETGIDVHSIVHDDDDAPEMYLMDVTKGENSTADFTWKNGWTEQKARIFCENNFQISAAFSVCNDNVPYVPSDSFIKECISDIKLAGDTSWMQVSVNNFGSACLSEASKIENLTETSNSTGSKNNTNNIFEMIAAATCPQNCSGQGVCNKGVCKCNDGYVGISCDKLESEAPILFSDSFDGHCDVRNRPCKRYVIPGLNFADIKLTCRYRHYEIYLNETVFTGLTEYSDGEYNSLFSVKCPAPHSRHKRSLNVDQSAMGYFISVSNDGKNFTEELAIIIFDSQCFECNTTDLSCEPVLTCPKVSKVSAETPVGTVIGAAFGGAVAVVAFVAVLFVLRNKMIKRRTKVKDSSASLPNETLVQEVR